MLTEIHIRDFALIEDLRLVLASGFNVLTGETGAGKSIIVDAITAVLGERLPVEAVRTGSDQAVIEAAFDISELPSVRCTLEEIGVESEDGLLLISRELSRTGRSQCRINGRLSTLSMLKQVTDGLIDVHGQHEHQMLLYVDRHVDALDNWRGREAIAVRERVAETHTELRSLQAELEKLRLDSRERARLLDLYEFQKNEITAAKLVTGEEEELLAERNRLANAEKLHALASSVYEALAGTEQGGAASNLSRALREAQQAASLDSGLEDVVRALENAFYATEEAESNVRRYRDEVEFNPGRLEEIEERLDLIRTLKKKYGAGIEEILRFGEQVERQVRDLEGSEERSSALEDQAAQVAERLEAECRDLTRIRQAAAGEFAALVEKELSELAMENTRFEVSIIPAAPGPKGADAVEFQISPNPGEPLKPLAKIASGGEMSRIMLALKSVMASADKVPTLIFDEIDAGVGGRTAQVIGDKLARVAEQAQVLCVTHLPQIACRAGSHIGVEKQVAGERTVVCITKLGSDERVEEIARMLAGEAYSETALTHAREMLGRD